MRGPVRVRLEFYLKDRRPKDADNLSKGVLDGLNKIVFKDDNQVCELLIIKHLDPDNPGVGVSVQAVEQAQEGEI
jgi:Holliday junction resolvase RusA-like endonuclease